MKMKTIKPLYLGGKTLVEGSLFVTDEQHGRQLLQKTTPWSAMTTVSSWWT